MTPTDLLHALADGEAHSGEELAQRFGVTRAAVWKHISRLGEWGLEVEAAPGVGYQLRSPIELLDGRELRAALVAPVRARVGSLEVFTELDSTNRYLLATSPPPVGQLNACIAEYQTAGRGRRGRRWSTPLGAGLCLSVSWQFADTPAELSALTLAVGVVAREALARVVGLDVRLKWPNDLVWDERKLGGILLELAAEAQGGCHVVAGLGINVALPPESLPSLCDWPRGAVDLASALGNPVPPRRLLAIALIEGLTELLARYSTQGFDAYREAWRSADFLLGRAVRLDAGGRAVTGVARGIEADGALLVETSAGERRRVIAGDVSVRSL